MDIRCPKCAEPWDMDSLHEEVAERWPDKPWVKNGQHDQTVYETYYGKVRAEFRAKGCAAFTSFGASCNPETAGSSTAAAVAAVLDLAGDDLDGAASDLDDLGHLGLL